MSVNEKDPVCGMLIDFQTYETIYAGARYIFCSDQCRERFIHNPHLYIGQPGQKAPKQRGVEILKHRHFKLEQPLSISDTNVLKNELFEMMGIRRVEIELADIYVTYDLIEASAEQIESKLVDIGIKLGEEWSQRLRLGLIHMLEETEVSSLEELPKSRKY